MSQGIQAASRGGKGQENGILPRGSSRNTALPTPSLEPSETHFELLTSRTVR